MKKVLLSSIAMAMFFAGSLVLFIYSSSEGDYWEEKRKHSPNDNYLLGFDEDVDDVHDMEIYIEDY